jgi:hypothetical protein
MLGIRDVKIAGPVTDWIPQVVQGSAKLPQPVGVFLAAGAWPALARTLPNLNLGLRQILNTCDSLGCVGKILSWCRHAVLLQSEWTHPDYIGIPANKLEKYSALELQSQYYRNKRRKA